jgi:hypothetical protein
LFIISPPNVYLNQATFFLHNEFSGVYVQSKDSIVFNESWIDHTDYLNQSIEIDAVAFAYQIMFDWFELKLVIPDSIKEKVLERVIDIKVKLTMN